MLLNRAIKLRAEFKLTSTLSRWKADANLIAFRIAEFQKDFRRCLSPNVAQFS